MLQNTKHLGMSKPLNGNNVKLNLKFENVYIFFFYAPLPIICRRNVLSDTKKNMCTTT
jgi:hypothetical protein